MADNDLTVRIKATDQTKAGIDSASGNFDRLKGTAMKLGSVLAGAFAVGQIIDFGQASLAAAIDAERANRQLEHAILDVSKGTLEQVDAVNALSEALQRKAGIDGDALKQGVAQLSTFGLQSETVVKLTKSLADLTVNQNGVNASADQYVQSANMIAKVLNGQFGILEKSGIRFTEAQQHLIQYGTETERVAAIQEGLNQNLRETTDTIGGSAEGAMARVTRAFGEVQESAGNILLPALAQVSEALVPLAQRLEEILTGAPKTGEATANLASLTKAIEEQTGAVTFLHEVWTSIGASVSDSLMPAFQELMKTLEPYMPWIKSFATYLGGYFGVILLGIVQTLGFAVMAFVELLAAAIRLESFLIKTLGPTFTFISDSIQNVVNWVTKLIDGLASVANKVGSAFSAANLIGGGLQARASGGPVAGGTSYLVGERGPELFTPATAGFVAPTGSFGGSSVSVNINGGMFLDEYSADMIGNKILDRLRSQLRF